MRYPRFFRLLIVLFALGLTGVGQARGDEPTPNFSPTITWTRDTVDSTGDVGQNASLALDPTTGLPQISYLDATAGDLRHAYKTNNPINTPCLTAGWECETWATYGVDGSYSSMAIRNNGNYGILYLNKTLNELHFRGDQGDGLPLGNHDLHTIPSSSSYSHDLRYDRNGTPHAVFVTSYANWDMFYYAKYTGNDDSCTGDDWDCEIIFSSFTGGIFSTSLGVTYYGSPRAAISSTDGLMYAVRVGSNGNCSQHWTCNQIESAIEATGLSLAQPSCQFICLGPVRIAYYDVLNGQLKIATGVESGGNCGVGNQAGKWQCDIIETIGTDAQYSLSLFVYNDQPYIAYTDGDDRANSTLKIAYPSPGGNCGPILNGAGTWQCDSIDTGFRNVGGFPIYRNVGLYPSMGINSEGTIYIAYYDSGADDLLVAAGQLDVPPPPASFRVYLPAVFQ